MWEKKIIINFLLEKVGELSQEVKRLNEVIDQIHVDCYCRDNWLNEREEKKEWEVVFENWESRIAQNFDQVKERIVQDRVVNIREIEELPF